MERKLSHSTDTTLSTCKDLRNKDLGQTTDYCCDEINAFGMGLYTRTIPTSAHGASVPLCTNDTKRCYQATVKGLELIENDFPDLDWLPAVAPFKQACHDLMHGIKFPPQTTDCQGGEKVQGKTHPDTLGTIMNMAVTYRDGLKDFVKAEEIFRLALDDHEKSLGKQHEYTKECAKGLAIL